MTLVKFLASPAGRLVRIVAGLIVGGIGLLAVTGAAQIVLLVIGVFLIAVGVLDVCVFAPLFGLSFRGPKIRGEN